MSAQSSEEDSARIAALKGLAKACKRPVPDTLFAALVIRGVTAEEAESILKRWDSEAHAEIGGSGWGNPPKDNAN